MAGNFEGIKNRRFGIEIEMTGMTRCSAAKAIRDVLGGSVEHIGGSYDKYKLYDEDGRAWSIVSDASIDPYKKNGDRASDLYKVEMNSPVLDYEDIPLLQLVIRGLRSAGAITGPQYDCGTHVHIDASDYDVQKIRNLVNIWSSKENFLWDALQVSSARATYCKKINPVIVIQNDIGNSHSETLIVIPITSMRKRYLPTHIMIGTDYGIERKSTALAEQITTIDKSRLVRYVGSVDKRKMDEIDEALKISLDLSE